MSLREVAFSSIRWTAAATVGRTVLQIVQVAILARLLAPQDFGLMAIVMAILAFMQMFVDFGVSSAIIHRQRITAGQFSSLYWLNILGGCLLCAVMLGLAAPLAVFFGDPRLQPLLAIASSSFVIASIGQQLRVKAEKDLNFKSLAKIELIASFSGLLVAVAIAVRGGGVYALIGGALASATVVSALAWAVLSDGWRPQGRLNLREIRPFLGFGGYVLGNGVINTVNSQADILLGGRVLDAGSLGSFSIPRDFCLRIAGAINPIVTRVGFPLMAKVQDERRNLRKLYSRTLRMTASVNAPVYLAIAVFAPELVMVLLGDQWEASIPLLRILALWGLVRSTISPVGSLLYGAGRADLSFKWNLGLLFVYPPALYVGVQHGALGMALMMLGFVSLLVPSSWPILIRPLTGMPIGEFGAQILVPIVNAGIAAVAAYGAAAAFSSAVPRLATGLAVGAGAYVLLSRFLNRPWFDAMLELGLKRRSLSDERTR